MTMTTTNRLQRDPVALSGVLFGVAIIAGVLLATAPRPDSPAGEIQRAFFQNAEAVQVQAFVQTLAAALLLPFAASLTGLVRRGENRFSGVAAATLGGGVLAAGFLMVQSLMTATLAAERTENAAVASALNQFVFYTGGVGHVVWLGVFVGAAFLAAHRARTLPRWLTTGGMVSAVLSILALLSLLVAPAALFIPVGRFSAIAVIAVAGVLMAAGRTSNGTAKTSVAASVLGGVGVVVLGFGLTVAV